MIQWKAIEYKEPTEQEVADEEKYWRSIRHYCFYCKAVTTFFRCYNCLKRFCSNHAYEEQDGTWETGFYTYLICYHCHG